MNEFWDVDAHVTSAKVFEQLVTFYKHKGKNKFIYYFSYCVARGEFTLGISV
jgi:hypothetical protein